MSGRRWTRITPTYHRRTVRAGHDRDVTVVIGAQHEGTVGGEPVEGQRTGMTVRVPGSDAGDRDACVHGVQEGRCREPGAVVRNLEHRGGQVHSGLQQVGLGGQFHVAGQQNPPDGGGGPQDQ
jgi:hypothetical protein